MALIIARLTLRPTEMLLVCGQKNILKDLRAENIHVKGVN